MCGITGYYSFSGNTDNRQELLHRAISKIKHRGPDNEGFYSDPRIALGHTRLSIIDISANGNQPMFDSTGNYVIVYNGMCYNYKELRARLEKKGIIFKSNSDTEAVLYWIIHHGPDGLKDINGFFSLALYNKKERKLLLARDRFGIKPLYYSTSNNGIAFGSELSSVTAYLGKCAIDPSALEAYLHLNYIPSPNTILQEVKKLNPGSYIISNTSGKTELHSYFNLEYGQSDLNEFHISDIENKLDRSVQRRLLSDVPIGCFLSGGLDSSILTGLASRHIDKLNTFTLAFKGDQQYDESSDALIVSKHFKTNHHEVEIENDELLEYADRLLSSVDEPFADSSGIAMYALSNKVNSSIKVALSGDGGDELFAGYHKHLALYYSFKYPISGKILGLTHPILGLLSTSREAGFFNSIRKMEKYASSSGLSPALRYWNWAGYGAPITLIMNSSFSSSQFLHHIHEKTIKTLDDCLKMDIRMVLEGDMLVKSDRMGMLNSLELRTPFLDHELVEMVSRIPSQKKIQSNDKKMLLKDSFTHMLPTEILNKKKHGFEVPLKRWLQTDLKDKVEHLLSDEIIAAQKLFDQKSVRKLKKLVNKTNSSNAEYSIWNLMMFNSWWLKNRDQIT